MPKTNTEEFFRNGRLLRSKGACLHAPEISAHASPTSECKTLRLDPYREPR
jgi:hypothetical protein